jgi:hypothetical protein
VHSICPQVLRRLRQEDNGHWVRGQQQTLLPPMPHQHPLRLGRHLRLVATSSWASRLHCVPFLAAPLTSTVSRSVVTVQLLPLLMKGWICIAASLTILEHAGWTLPVQVAPQRIAEVCRVFAAESDILELAAIRQKGWGKNLWRLRHIECIDLWLALPCPAGQPRCCPDPCTQRDCTDHHLMLRWTEVQACVHNCAPGCRLN